MTMMDNIIAFLMIMEMWVLGLSVAWFIFRFTFDKIFPDDSKAKRRGF